MDRPIRVLIITNAWPTPGRPATTHFIKRQVDYLQAAGVDVDVFYFPGAKNPANYLRAWKSLRRKLAQERYDLLHAQFGQCGLVALPKRLPLIVTFRGSDLHGIVRDADGRHTVAGRILKRVSQAVASHADAIIVVSEHMKGYIDGSTPVHVIPSGIDFGLFRCMPRDEARHELGLPLTERLVLFVGDPSRPVKRYELAREAVRILNLSLSARLILAWGIPHSDIPIFMNACDVLVLTSVHEGSPDVVKEALACDLPVVSVPVGDVALRLEGIEGCELCADTRPETIAASLEQVLTRGQRVAGREAVKSLDEKLLTEEVIDVYRSVLVCGER